MLNNVVSIFSGVAAAAGDYESIATVSVGAGGASTVTFSGIPSTYSHLQIRGIARDATGGGTGTDVFVMRFNSDSGANYTSNHVLFGNGSSASAAASGTSQTGGFITNFPASGETSNAFGVFVADVLDYANTNKNKTVRGLGGYDGNNTSGIVTFRSFAWMNTNAVTSITFSYFGNFAQYSHFALYGIKSA